MIPRLDVGGQGNKPLLVIYGSSIDAPLSVESFIRLAEAVAEKDINCILETLYFHQVYRLMKFS